MSPDQKAASIHLAFVFMTIQGRGQHQVRPTEIHRDYFVNVGCLCSVGVFYNRLLKLCRSLFVLVSQQGRSEHRNCFGFPLSLFLNFCSFLLFFLLRQSTASPTPSFFFFFLKISKMWSIWSRISIWFRSRLGLPSLLTHWCLPMPHRNHSWEQVPLLSVSHQSQLLATLRHPHNTRYKTS